MGWGGAEWDVMGRGEVGARWGGVWWNGRDEEVEGGDQSHDIRLESQKPTVRFVPVASYTKQ